jgi:hypothetical protein
LDITAGSFGIAAAKRKTKCTIVSFMVLCIIAASLNLFQLSFGILGAVVSAGCNYYWSVCNVEVISMNSLLALSAVIAGIIAICGSALSCTVLCGNSSSQVGGDGVRFMVVTGGPGSQPQAAMPVVFLAPGTMVAGNQYEQLLQATQQPLSGPSVTT